MSKMRSLIRRIEQKRPLYTQILFTLLAFLAMVVISYIFVSRIVQNHLVRYTESVLSFQQTKLETDLQEHRLPLEILARAVKGIILQGGSVRDLRNYMDDMSRFLLSNEKHRTCFNGFSGYFETLPGGPVFMTGLGWRLQESLEPQEREWYKAAVAANGHIAETLAYVDFVTREAILVYSICIFDDVGRRLGVINLRIRVNTMGREVVDTALARGGYGMLLSEDLVMIAHPRADFIGVKLNDLRDPITTLEKNLRTEMNISEYEIKNYKDEDCIAFFCKLSNGWYLGLLTPKGPYLKSVTNMMIFLTVLGAALAAVLIFTLIRIDIARNKLNIESQHKSIFLANMSHEIRTPMNSIIGMSTIGKSTIDAERKDYCFSRIEDASHHLLGVINDILDMSKIEANKFELAHVEFDFERLLQRIVNVVSFRVDQKQQKFTMYIDPFIPKNLIGDDQRLAQVITNLLGNAIKFTPEQGFISLDARYMGADNDNCTIQISVRDTGIGISAEQQKMLFHSFEQTGPNTARKFGGTGLGLAISKSIVEMMGGRISLQSEPGKGSNFIFTVQVKMASGKEHRILSPGVSWDNVRILAVDDDRDVLRYFGEIAQGFGVYCDTAASGEDALTLVDRNGAYHIYFIDWKMPGMDGIQLVRELKSHIGSLSGSDHASKSVVVLISAAEWTPVEEEAKEAGVDKFLSKPLFPSTIEDTISESLGLEPQIEKMDAKIAEIFKGRHILLAEDVEINREIVRAMFKTTLMEIDYAENGLQAVQMFEAAPEKYDLILMDMQMPEMDGYEAARRIRALEHPLAKTVWIIAMTANVFRDDIEKCLEAGMDNHVGKPLDFNEVIAKLRMYLPANHT